MNIQNINNKIICNPTSIEDIEALSHLSELKEFDEITIDLIDLDAVENKNSSSNAIFIGWAIDAVKKGKKITILSSKKVWASQHLKVVNI